MYLIYFKNYNLHLFFFTFYCSFIKRKATQHTHAETQKKRELLLKTLDHHIKICSL